MHRGKQWWGAMFACLWTAAQATNHGVPLSPEDRERLDHAFALTIPWTPRLTQSIDGRPVVLGAVLFDGTRNDRLNVPADERQTVVARLRDELYQNNSIAFVHYYPGAGTQSNRVMAFLDSAFGFTVKKTANAAVDEVIAAIDEARSRQADADVRLLVSGFSRGGAAARHFMNAVERRWREKSHIGTPPRFYALIFDTVATGQRRSLWLQVPQSADLFYHFVSLDERRILFRPIVDTSRDIVSGRIVTIPMPGVHSDVGAAYALGVGTEYLANIDALLASMELLPAQCFDVAGDARAQGKNDSRWAIERLRGIGAPNTKGSPPYRGAFYVASDPVPDGFWPEWQGRMRALEFKGSSSVARCTKSTGTWLPEFRVTHSGSAFDVISLPPFTLPSARIISEKGGHFLTYTIDGSTLSRIPMSSSLLANIAEGTSAKISLAVVEDRTGGSHFYWYFNDVLTEEIEGTFR